MQYERATARERERKDIEIERTLPWLGPLSYRFSQLGGRVVVYTAMSHTV